MVTYTSTLIDTRDASLIGAPSATVDRYRPALSLPPEPVSCLVAAKPRTIAPIFAAFTGGVRPDADDSRAFVDRDSRMTWHLGNTTTVFGGGFASLADDITTRTGPPPPRSSSV